MCSLVRQTSRVPKEPALGEGGGHWKRPGQNYGEGDVFEVLDVPKQDTKDSRRQSRFWVATLDSLTQIAVRFLFLSGVDVPVRAYATLADVSCGVLIGRTVSKTQDVTKRPPQNF